MSIHHIRARGITTLAGIADGDLVEDDEGDEEKLVKSWTPRFRRSRERKNRIIQVRVRDRLVIPTWEQIVLCGCIADARARLPSDHSVAAPEIRLEGQPDRQQPLQMLLSMRSSCCSI